jgi:hypothetical protein
MPRAPVSAACAEIEKRFQKLASDPPVHMYATDDPADDNLYTGGAYATNLLAGLKGDYAKELHADFVYAVSGKCRSLSQSEHEAYERITKAYPTRPFYHATRNRPLEEIQEKIDKADGSMKSEYRAAKKKAEEWFDKLDDLHREYFKCLRSTDKDQLMGEQLSRESCLHADVMKSILGFTYARDPKRIAEDSYRKNGPGVDAPRGGRRTRRTKRRGTSRRARR